MAVNLPALYIRGTFFLTCSRNIFWGNLFIHGLVKYTLLLNENVLGKLLCGQFYLTANKIYVWEKDRMTALFFNLLLANTLGLLCKFSFARNCANFVWNLLTRVLHQPVRQFCSLTPQSLSFDFIPSLIFLLGRNSVVGTVDRIAVGARRSAPVHQSGPGAHLASCTMGTGPFPGVKQPGRGASHPTPSSGKSNERVELYLYAPLGLMPL
jgi:hypothetical protein